MAMCHCKGKRKKSQWQGAVVCPGEKQYNGKLPIADEGKDGAVAICHAMQHNTPPMIISGIHLILIAETKNQCTQSILTVFYGANVNHSKTNYYDSLFNEQKPCHRDRRCKHAPGWRLQKHFAEHRLSPEHDVYRS